MRLDNVILGLTLATSAAATAIDPAAQLPRSDIEQTRDEHELYKRRGGGGGGGRGGGGGSSGGSSGKGGSSGSSGSSGKGGSSGSGSSGSSGKGGSGSSSGGSRGGSGSSYPGYGGYSGTGPRPSYGGGQYYGGGSTVPYRAGRSSPAAGIAPFFLVGGALAFWPGYWAHGAYIYNYHDDHDYEFHNDTSDKDEKLPVTCACAKDQDCGCDEADNDDVLDDLIGNGSYAALNKSIINVAEVNGTKKILLNGTLPDGTALSEDDADSAGGGDSAATAMQALGFWPAVAAVAAAVFIA